MTIIDSNGSGQIRLKGIFLDIEDTLTHEGKPIAGAAEVVNLMRNAGFNLRFITNITGRLPSVIAEDLCSSGIEVATHEVQTAASASADYLKTRQDCTAYLIISENIQQLFDGIACDGIAPDVVVIGDIAEAFSFDIMNKAFQLIDSGAELVAMSRNMFWFNNGRKQLDAGAFVSALELATGKPARNYGKPSASFFSTALHKIGLLQREVLVVGDDVLTDIVVG